MASDFPAAHSMDTTWFAVDRDGHVGEFSSWEAGAVPRTGFQRSLSHDLPATEVIVDYAGRQQPWNMDESPLAIHRSLPHLEQGYRANVLVFVDNGPEAPALLRGAGGKEVRTTRGLALLLPLPAGAAWLRDLHNRQLCLGCHVEIDVRTDDDYHPGFFVYQHLYENWVAGPYGRHLIPVQPVHVDQLSPLERERVLKTRFASLSFTEAVYVQPTEHFECEAWGSVGLSSDGRHLRPVLTASQFSASTYRNSIEWLMHHFPARLRGVQIEWPRKSRE